jgi:hypothetical protein
VPAPEPGSPAIYALGAAEHILGVPEDTNRGWESDYDFPVPAESPSGAAAYEGTGVGLALCSAIVELSGGRPRVEPGPAGCSRLCLTAPDRGGPGGG